LSVGQRKKRTIVAQAYVIEYLERELKELVLGYPTNQFFSFRGPNSGFCSLKEPEAPTKHFYRTVPDCDSELVGLFCFQQASFYACNAFKIAKTATLKCIL